MKSLSTSLKQSCEDTILDYVIGIKDIFECFMMVLNYRAAVLKARSPKG